jgi:hypothetical protein
MSAFTDWNGPGCGGASLPQLRTLEEILAKVTALGTDVGTLKTDLSNHASYSTPQTHAGIATLIAGAQAAAVTLAQNYVDNYTTVPTPNSLYGRVLTAANTYTDGKVTAIGVTTTGLRTDLDALRDSSTGQAAVERTRALAAEAALKALIDALNTLVDTVTLHVDYIDSHTPSLSTIEIRKNLKALDVLIGKLQLAIILDFTKWAHFGSYTVQATNGDKVCILGTLSKEYIDQNPAIVDDKQLHKPARAYIKYTNTMPWNAIVDMSGTIAQVSGVLQYTGSINALTAKTSNRDDIKYGLYHGSTTAGVEYIYLGVVVQESQNMGTYLSGLDFYVVGENFKPLIDSYVYLPNGSVVEITSSTAKGTGGVGFNDVTVSGTIYTDNYYDIAGNQVLVTNEFNNTLSLGDPTNPKQLLIYSDNRPTVQHKDLSKHEIAYLTDLADSIYWQRSVTLIEKDIDKLNAMKVRAIYDSVSGTYRFIPPDSTESGWADYPGYYLSNPSIGTNIAGRLFASGDTALVKDSGSTQQVVDGKLNGELIATPLSFTYEQLTATDIDEIKVGTTFHDNNGAVGSILTLDPIARTFTAQLGGTVFTYTQPGYASYNGTTWSLDDVVPIPETFDGHIHDITYEWNGVHVYDEASLTPYYVLSYILWTVHHENNVTMNYTGDPWDYITVNMDLYRTSDRQNIIDNVLETLASMQPDYGENKATMEFTLPEQSPKTIANPAFINNRPWTGLAVVDGGTFLEPLVYSGWMTDGGDFTGIMSTANPGVVPPIPANQQFRNAIIKLWRGAYTDMPENSGSVSAATWSTFAHTLRWAQFTAVDHVDELMYSDGVQLYRFISHKSLIEGQYLMQTLEVSVPDVSQYQLSFAGTDFTVPGSPISFIQTILFDHVVVDNNPTLAFSWNDTDKILTVTSPRMDAIEQDILATVTKATEPDPANELTILPALPSPLVANAVYRLTATVDATGAVVTYSWEV